MCLLRMETVFDSVSAFVQENGDRGDDESLNVENTLWANTVVASGKISNQASHFNPRRISRKEFVFYSLKVENGIDAQTSCCLSPYFLASVC